MTFAFEEVQSSILTNAITNEDCGSGKRTLVGEAVRSEGLTE